MSGLLSCGNVCELHFAGLVPLGQTPPPKYALDVTLGSNTVINYGCYGNRQRKEIQAFFFPVDHVEQSISCLPQPGERRIHTAFDISVSLTSSAQLNLGFSFQQSQHYLSIAMETNSTVSIQVPWITSASGSTSSVKGQLLGVNVNSSLPYPFLGKAAHLEFDTSLHFPRLWNSVQKWEMKFSGERVEANILFAYIDFVNGWCWELMENNLITNIFIGLLDDWVGNEPNDLVNFVPVDWSIDIALAHYEIFLFTNRYNWLDVLRDDMENARLAFCGTNGTISFKLPFTEFIPLQQPIRFTARVSLSIILCVFH